MNAYATSGNSPTKHKRKLKVVTINAQFPELKGDSTHQMGTGHGSSLRVAFAAAGRDLFSRPRLKRKRFTQFTVAATVAIVEEAA
jgi:hypothetical protein